MIKVDVEYKAFDAMQTSTEGSPIIFIWWKKKKAQRVQGIKCKISNKSSIMDSIGQPDFNT